MVLYAALVRAATTYEKMKGDSLNSSERLYYFADTGIYPGMYNEILEAI